MLLELCQTSFGNPSLDFPNQRQHHPQQSPLQIDYLDFEKPSQYAGAFPIHFQELIYLHQ